MNIKFFILLCYTYYCPSVYPMDQKNIDKLWNSFKPNNRDYITKEDYKGHDELSFDKALLTYATDENKSRLNYAEFTEAANSGLITILPKLNIGKFWKLFNPNDQQYITKENYIGYDEPKFNEALRNYATDENKSRLSYAEFTEAANSGLLSIVSRSKIDELWKLLNPNTENKYITEEDYKEDDDLQFAIIEYGTKIEGTNISGINYERFTWIANLGLLSRWPKLVMMDEFLRLLPKGKPKTKNKNEFYLTTNDLKELNKDNGRKYTLEELNCVTGDFGDFELYEHSTSTNTGQYVLTFKNYCRAVASERLPGRIIEEIEVPVNVLELEEEEEESLM